jgi:peptidoglycan hydrolase CwlO-like protein
MPHHFTAPFHSFILPILLLISIQIFAFTIAVHPLKVRRDEQKQQLKNEDLTAELANLERQIEKIVRKIE